MGSYRDTVKSLGNYLFLLDLFIFFYCLLPFVPLPFLYFLPLFSHPSNPAAPPSLLALCSENFYPGMVIVADQPPYSNSNKHHGRVLLRAFEEGLWDVTVVSSEREDNYLQSCISLVGLGLRKIRKLFLRYAPHSLGPHFFAHRFIT